MSFYTIANKDNSTDIQTVKFNLKQSYLNTKSK